MSLVAASRIDTFAGAAALVTLLLLVWVFARFAWFSRQADKADERTLSGIMVAVSAVVIAILIAAAILGPHPA